jgi:predicted RNase H-like HicB family nuclease
MAVQERPGRQATAPGTVDVSPVPKPVVTFFAGLRKIFGKAEAERECIWEPAIVSHEGTWKLRVSVEPDDLDGGFVAECLDVPGAMSQGETEGEALESLIDAVQGVVAVKMEEHFRTADFDLPSQATSSRAGRVVNVTF